MILASGHCSVAAPQNLAPGVYRVDAFRFSNFISVLLLQNDDGWTLVDTGVDSSVGRIEEALASLGSGPRDLKRIFITHQHNDHTGGLKGLLEWAPHAEVGASEHEAKVISGELPYDPSDNRFVRYMTRNAEPPGVPVARTLGEGDLVSGFRVISTPGHSPGHVSLLRDADGLLFTADAFGCLPRKLRVGLIKAFCTDPPMAKRSAQKLLREDFATVILSHGPVMRSGGREKLQRAIDSCHY
jgi:glyoxylase-like metal-dependent hydrolase (beta-lactamase superfamily II)